MIGSLRGTVLERSGDSTVMIDVGGVGYLVTVTPKTFGELEPTSTAFLHIHHHIREDAQTLFGFVDRLERETFETLLSVHGVGPAMAIAVLSTHGPHALVDIVASADLAALTTVPGVGRKTAERMVMELKDKLSLPVLDAAQSAKPSVAAAVRDALVGLGYSPDEIRESLRGVAEGSSAEEALRHALGAMGARRA
jgi:Holliday junction DNA helicase RuvA